MVNCIIIEDEYYAVKELKSAIAKLRPDYHIACTAEDTESAMAFLSNHPVDLIFSDVRLSDGLSFNIFGSINIPTIFISGFISGYEEYASQAVSYNCVDFILKPYSEEQLHRAICRFEVLSGLENSQSDELCPFQIENAYSSYLFAKAGHKIVAVKKDDIAYIDKGTTGAYLHLLSGEVLKCLSKNGSATYFGKHHGFVELLSRYMINMNSVECVKQRLLGRRKKLIFKSEAKLELKVPLYYNRKSFY